MEQIADLVNERKDELKHILSDLVSFPTVSPPARNTEDIQAYIMDFLIKEGFETTSWDVFPHDANVVGIKQGAQRDAYHSLIINGHVDVAEVGEETNWSVPVFELTEMTGYLYGRGVADMKGGIAAALLAIKILNEQGITLKGDVQFQSVIGEEAGEAGTLSCIEKGYDADFALVVDSSNRQIHGQGGVITGWVTVKSKEVFHDAMRVELLQESSKGASAIEKMMDIIGHLQSLEREWRETKHYPGFKKGTNTINPAVIEGGRHAAFIADECRLWITVHFYPNENYQSVLTEIESYLIKAVSNDPWFQKNPLLFHWGGKSMIEEKGEIFPSCEIDTKHPAIEMLQDAHSEIEQAQPIIGNSKSVTDVGWFYNAGIPAALYGPGTLEEAHSVDEKVEFDDLVAFTKTLITFMLTWCNSKKGS